MHLEFSILNKYNPVHTLIHFQLKRFTSKLHCSYLPWYLFYNKSSLWDFPDRFGVANTDFGRYDYVNG